MEPTQLRSAGSREGILGILAHWAFLYAFWVVLSGMFDPFHLGAGLLATGLVAVLTHELQYFEHGSGGRLNLALALAPWHRHLRYALWLWWEIVKANVQVARIVLHPKLPIRPAMIPYRTLLRSDLGKTLLANSITLTPGTVTVLVEERRTLDPRARARREHARDDRGHGRGDRPGSPGDRTRREGIGGMNALLVAFSAGTLAMVLVTGTVAIVRPGVLDRIIAVGVLGTKTTVLLAAVGLGFGRVEMFVDIALTYALLNFLLVLAVAKYFARGGEVP
ncbi:MAG: hypothetical protein KatS3mg076_1741 [Candidatus Binatia bacterium]|nr:MAG: hypothetical protein KatS3mg076_1741 [Candidatus Binatia bacterium]